MPKKRAAASAATRTPGPVPPDGNAGLFSVVLTAAGCKLHAIIAVREVTSMGLKEAKDLVDGAPKPVKEGVSKEEAEAIKNRFAKIGASVEVIATPAAKPTTEIAAPDRKASPGPQPETSKKSFELGVYQDGADLELLDLNEAEFIALRGCLLAMRAEAVSADDGGEDENTVAVALAKRQIREYMNVFLAEANENALCEIRGAFYGWRLRKMPMFDAMLHSLYDGNGVEPICESLARLFGPKSDDVLRADIPEELQEGKKLRSQLFNWVIAQISDITIVNLQRVARFIDIAKHSRGCATPAEGFLTKLVMLHYDCGGLTPDMVAEELDPGRGEGFRCDFEDLLDQRRHFDVIYGDRQPDVRAQKEVA